MKQSSLFMLCVLSFLGSFAQIIKFKNLHGWWELIDDKGNEIANFSIRDSINLFEIGTGNIQSDQNSMPGFYKLYTNNLNVQYLVLGYPRQTDTLYMSFKIQKANHELYILTGYYTVYYKKISKMWVDRHQSRMRTFKLKTDHRSHQG